MHHDHTLRRDTTTYLQAPTSKNKTIVEQWSTGAGQPDSAHVDPIVFFLLQCWVTFK